MDHRTLPKPQACRPPKTLADVLITLENHPDLRADRRRNMISSLRCLCRWLGSDPSAVPADPGQLRNRLDAMCWQTTGLSRSYITGLKGQTLAGLKAAGVDALASRSRLPLSAEWSALKLRIDDLGIWCPLSRMAAYCTEHAIEPAAVDEAALTRFESAMLQKSIKSDPAGSAGRTRRAWRKASVLVANARAYELPPSKNERRYSLNWEDFPASFIADVDAFTSARSTSNPFAVNYCRPVAKSTAHARRNQIRQLASALIGSGFPIEKLTDLAILTKLENAEASLAFLWQRAGSKETKFQGQQALLLKTIARYHTNEPVESVTRLKELASAVGIRKQGMVAKNREKLRQFDLKDNIYLLLDLPEKVFTELGKKKVLSIGDGLRGLYAMATQILLRSPIRCTNLCLLELGTQIQTVRRGNSEAKHLVLEKTKNGDSYEVALPTDTIQILEQYLATIRPTITQVETNWLFPNAQGASRNPTSFGRGLESFVEKETGLLMNPHCFRHFSVFLSRRMNPGDVETPRQLLGHRDGNSIKSYAVIDNAGAARRHDEMIAKLRAERPLFPTPAKPSRKKP